MSIQSRCRHISLSTLTDLLYLCCWYRSFFPKSYTSGNCVANVVEKGEYVIKLFFLSSFLGLRFFDYVYLFCREIIWHGNV